VITEPDNVDPLRFQRFTSFEVSLALLFAHMNATVKPDTYSMTVAIEIEYEGTDDVLSSKLTPVETAIA
jgi:hypothetical protein